MHAEIVFNGTLNRQYQQREQRSAPPECTEERASTHERSRAADVLAVVAFDEWAPIRVITRRCRGMDQRCVSMQLLRFYRRGWLLRRGTRKSYEYRRVV